MCRVDESFVTVTYVVIVALLYVSMRFEGIGLFIVDGRFSPCFLCG